MEPGHDGGGHGLRIPQDAAGPDGDQSDGSESGARPDFQDQSAVRESECHFHVFLRSLPCLSPGGGEV